MATFSILFILLGFWICYQKSERAELPSPTKWEEYLRKNKKMASVIGIASLTVGFVFSLIVYGVGSGIFVYTISMIIVASLVIVLAPLGYINRWNIVPTLLLCFLLEITL
ncbi:hypothetical protein JKA74_03300 [Marivirga sp. S37H4]|uniref:DUF3325 domain-containing protein n=1 Tax=Marivirga aurantiaca TaxID=2802615 RepID=A0A934WW62_9BACT|nr:hypothetical protein [Marivirga aurantiaca]MBK6264052.1 hypothetical protein [Marivirga aurantiaca]